MPQRFLIWLGWAAVLTLATLLRLSGLDERPVHADEATGARILAQRLEGQGYAFDPQHFHGPWLSIATVPANKIRGESSWQDLSITTLRSTTVIAGLLLVLTPLLWTHTLGNGPALVAGSLLASSPLLVYYGQMYIHESWLALFGMLALAMVYHLWKKPTLWKGLLSGVCIALMFVTKETVAISVLSWLAALIVCSLPLLFAQQQRISLKPYIRPSVFLVIAFLGVSAIFYTDGFRYPQGFLDAFKTYFVYETTAGHDKPASYYLHFLLWPKKLIGMYWSEGLILLLAAASIPLAFRMTHIASAVALIACAVIGHLAIYSAISYKTPWLMMLPWAHICLLAGAAFYRFKDYRPTIQLALLALLMVTVGFQTKQSIQATGRFANDERNPYSYVPTTKDPARIASWFDKIAQVPGVPALSPVAVVGQGYWPLPWYLREIEQIGYWPAPVDSLVKLPIVISMPEYEASCGQQLSDTHTAFPYSLRSNVSITVYLHNDIWEAWLQHTPE